MNYSEQMEKYGFVAADHESPKRFPVTLEKVYTQSAEVVPGYLAIQRPDTREILHVATDSYTLIPHEQWESAFNTAINESKLPVDDMMVQRDDSHNGCRAFGCYVLPAVQENVGGSNIALTLGWGNSYDGSIACNVYGGHLKFNCNNQARTGNMIHSRRHVGDINVEEIVANLLTAAESYHATMLRMRDWPSKQITDSHFIEVTEQLEGSNKRLQGELLTNWLKAKDNGQDGGSTLWTAYNVLTAWSTHGDGYKAATRAYAKANREERVAALIETDTWNVLAA